MVSNERNGEEAQLGREQNGGRSFTGSFCVGLAFFGVALHGFYRRGRETLNYK